MGDLVMHHEHGRHVRSLCSAHVHRMLSDGLLVPANDGLDVPSKLRGCCDLYRRYGTLSHKSLVFLLTGENTAYTAIMDVVLATLPWAMLCPIIVSRKERHVVLMGLSLGML